jgi:excisionase family DNA binding protein
MAGEYVTTGAAAKALGVALTTLQRWAHAGLVTPAYQTPGGHFRWDLDALRAQLKAVPHADSPSGDQEP